jgi:hypothetical protein
MKKSITILTLLAGAVGAYAQGTINWADYYGTFGITVYSSSTGVSTAAQITGNSTYDLSQQAGGDTFAEPTTAYGGTLVALGGANTGATSPTDTGNGNLWTIALYAAPGVNNLSGLSAAETSVSPVGTSLFSTSGGVGTANAGLNGNDSAGGWLMATKTVLTLNGYTGGATFQLAAWYNGGSANLTYAQAAAAGDPVGMSAYESIGLLGGNGIPPAILPTLGLGLVPGDGTITSFSLTTTTPEPSTIALGVIGASALLFRRRK